MTERFGEESYARTNPRFIESTKAYREIYTILSNAKQRGGDNTPITLTRDEEIKIKSLNNILQQSRNSKFTTAEHDTLQEMDAKIRALSEQDDN